MSLDEIPEAGDNNPDYVLHYDAMPLMRPLPIEESCGLCCCEPCLSTTRQWQLEEAFYFYLDGQKYRIDRGFVFNATSVPSLLQWWHAPTGITMIADIIHDWTYRYASLNKVEGDSGNTHDKELELVSEVPLTQTEADWIFYKTANNSMLLYSALLCAGFVAWNRNRTRENDGKWNMLEDKPMSTSMKD